MNKNFTLLSVVTALVLMIGMAGVTAVAAQGTPPSTQVPAQSGAGLGDQDQICLLDPSGICIPDQDRDQLRTHDQDQSCLLDPSGICIPDQDRDQLRTHDQDQSCLLDPSGTCIPDQTRDQLRTKDQIHQNLATSSASVATGAVNGTKSGSKQNEKGPGPQNQNKLGK
jgi:hypothetical protein